MSKTKSKTKFTNNQLNACAIIYKNNREKLKESYITLAAKEKTGKDNTGHLNTLFKYLVEIKGWDVNATYQGQTALRFSMESNNTDMFKYLVLEQNCNITETDKIKTLFFAAETNSVEVMKNLIEIKKFNINSKGEHGNSLLAKAIGCNSEGVIKYLIGENIDICAVNDSGYRMLHVSALNKNTSLMDYFIFKKMNINQTCKDGFTALSLAILYDNTNVINHVINMREFDINAPHGMYTPLKLAITQNKPEAIKLLFENKNIDINALDTTGNTPLHLAVEGDLLPIVKLLLEKGCDINLLDQNEHSPLFTAIRLQNSDIVKLLINQPKCDINLQNTDGVFPLIIAVNTGNLNIVKLLLEKGCNINFQNSFGATVLHYASKVSDLPIIKFLVEKGGDINIKAYEDSMAPIDLAKLRTDPSIIKYFKSLEKDTELKPLFYQADVCQKESNKKDSKIEFIKNEDIIEFINYSEHLTTRNIEIMKFFTDYADVSKIDYSANNDLIRILTGNIEQISPNDYDI